MVSKEVTVLNATGIHARPAAIFVKTASGFKADVNVSKDGKTVSAKSIIGVLSLCINKGSKITITANGEDEGEALAALVNLVDSKFGEE
ncbi:HPr family phosphocarrier protein [Caloramator sp. E03]|uniref:HPr family phosphocarrier protein n=1 Tax=Caloramator sp. E03 TaxID=2576307 RepID=UPI0011105E92|nr:HPr family phosphocarrier protein [Caloramator sp. E03]QCX34156.1 HPr family phosphocarrier protein [Caloramator sp. E03]